MHGVAVPKPARRAKPTRTVRVRRKRKGKRASLKREANRLWSLIVRHNGRCVFIGEMVGRKLHLECGGPIQAMHCLGKKSYPGTRYDLRNGVPGCRDVHAYYTHHPEEFGLWLARWWGPEEAHRIKTRAVTQIKLDMSAIVASLRDTYARMVA